MTYRSAAGPSRVVKVGRHVYTVTWPRGDLPATIELRKHTWDSHEFWHLVWSSDRGRAPGPKMRTVIEVARAAFRE